MLSSKFVRFFSFFNKQISTKYGEKCCKYGQNGIPLPKESVERTVTGLGTMLKGWKVDDKATMLYRFFYAKDYLNAVQFIKEVAKLDALSTKNQPSFHLTKGELLKIELYSPPLMGLSQVDFELALAINQLKFNEYELEPIEGDEKAYKLEIQKKQRAKVSADLQAKLAETFNSKNAAK
jgi:pterin-4a-carbinolamine dehydratase